MPVDLENSPGSVSTSPSTAITSPDRLLNVENDDIWESDGSPSNTITGRARQEELLSDIPIVKRRHMTDGYREGLTVGKASVMQQGFDDGYPIGTAVALRVGLILGILEGIASSQISQQSESKASIHEIYDQAQEELSCSTLLKNLDDESIAKATTIPVVIETIISRWEHRVLGAPRKSND